MKIRFLFFLGVLYLAPLHMAAAHPHVFIDQQATLLVNEDLKATGLHQEWQFDSIFSNQMLNDFDEDQNQTLSKTEKETLIRNVVKSMAEYSYFTYPFLDNLPYRDFKIENFSVDYESTDKAFFRFDIVWEKPIDPFAQKLGFSFYDSSYYVEVNFSEAAPLLLPPALTHCKTVITTDEATHYYYDLLNPERVTLLCTSPSPS